jgi:hypothetical protein
MLLWSQSYDRVCPCSKDDGQPVVFCGGLDWLKPNIFLLCCWLSKLNLSLVGVSASMWPGQTVVVSTVIIFHNNIGVFILVFGRFPINKTVISSF